jgi:hypothetical protein
LNPQPTSTTNDHNGLVGGMCLIKEGPSFAQFLARFEPTNQFQQQNNNNGWVGGMFDNTTHKKRL